MTRHRGLLASLVLGFGAATRLPGQADSAISPLRLKLNLAATRLDLYRNDSLVARFPVAVGQRDYPTPLGSWNPWWIPPTSDWTRGKLPTPPGPTSRVKLNFKPLYFLHGTPDEASIGSASSRGCVRLRNADAIELAIEVMHAGIPAGDSVLTTVLATDTTATCSWLLERPVPIVIVSRPVEIERDTLFLFPEPYLQRPASAIDLVFAALRVAALGRPIDSVAVARFAATARGRPAKVPVRSLLRGPP